MPTNVGTIDRLIRAVIGLVAIGFVFFGPIAATGGWGLERIGLLAIGSIMLATSAVKFCPLYRIIGLRTCESE